MNGLGSESATMSWRKSSRSVSKGDCVEVTHTSGCILIRDSMRTNRSVLDFTAPEWRTFVYGMKHGDFDRLR